MKYFTNVKSKTELRTEYLSLLKKYHPDNGGDEETCKQINYEYEVLLQTQTFNTSEYPTEEENKATADFDEKLREALDKIVHFSGIDIEVVGTWIWLDGNTYEYKEDLKELGYKWSKSRQKWHFAPYGEFHYYKGQRKTFNYIRKCYGSSKVKTDEEPLKLK